MEHLVNICARRAYRLYIAGTESEGLIHLDDLKHAGIIGYLEAESRFDESKGVDRKTFLGYRVRGAIVDWLRKQPLVSLPQVQYGRVKALRECRESLQKSGKDASDEKLAEVLDWNIEKVRKASSIAPHVYSLDKELSEDGATGMDMLAGSDLEPVDRVAEKEIAELIDFCLRNLPASDDRLIVLARVQQDIKLKNLATQFGCSPQAIHQREKRALEKLKECLAAEGWNWQEE